MRRPSLGPAPARASLKSPAAGPSWISIHVLDPSDELRQLRALKELELGALGDELGVAAILELATVGRTFHR